MQKILITAILIFITLNGFSQKLKISDLQNICNKSNWESVNQHLMNKNWEFAGSEKGSSFKYSTITWSYNKSYNDEAEAWFYLFTYDGLPNKISYSVFNKASYSIIQNSLTANGYKLVESAIEDNEVISTYDNNKFILKITTEKREKDGYSYSDESITAYRFMLIKKSGVYDPDNGNKFAYWDDGYTVKAEFTLKNGELHGERTRYFSNGSIKEKGIFSNGIGNGNFVEYNMSGEITKEYVLKNDEISGIAFTYENGLKQKKITFENGAKTGDYVEYYYDSEDELFLKTIGNYKNDELDGRWETIRIEGNIDEVIEYWNYKNGIRDGEFLEYIGSDSIVKCNYINGELNGEYSVKTKITFLDPETYEESFFWSKESEGHYLKDLKSGEWTHFLMGTRSEEGHFISDQKEGAWKSYITMGNHSGALQSETNYHNGEKNGLKLVYYSTDWIDDSKNGEVSMSPVNKRILEKTMYKDNLKNGLYELMDSLEVIQETGTYLNDKKTGVWFEYIENDNGEKDQLEINYQNDELKGRFIRRNSENKIIVDGNYLWNNQSGTWKYLDDYGVIRESREYSNYGLLMKTSYFNENGNISLYYHFDGDYRDVIIKYLDNIDGEIFCKTEVISKNNNKYKLKVTGLNGDTTTIEHYNLTSTEDLDFYSYSSGEKHGESSTFVQNKLIESGKYVNDNKEGIWSSYYQPENVRIDQKFYYGNPSIETFYFFEGENLFSGVFILTNHEDGSREEIKVKDGLRNGKSVVFDKAGNVLEKKKYKDGVIKQ
jgi:antitoxin component YwqK of YwqJK toxin-antitoxin module